MRRALTVAVLAAASLAAAATGRYEHEQYGYVPIDQYGGQMFYALRASESLSQANLASLPLVMWLQGGPGASSMFSDFLETGPVKVKKDSTSPKGYVLQNNSLTWANHATMLYVDNPLGTGFSFVNDSRSYATTDTIIANDLVTFLTMFFEKHPQYRTNDFWVFCESYGGKMTAYLGAALVDAIAAKKLAVNFKGVALGDGWVDPIGCMESYGPYLSAFSQVNAAQAKAIDQYASLAKQALAAGNGAMSTNYWGSQQQVIGEATANVNWYNVLYYYDYTSEDQWKQYMKTTFTQKLGSLLPPGYTFAEEGGAVFNHMAGSFMNDGISQVQHIIDAGYKVAVYGGQVDLIVDTVCIQGWIKKLPWGSLSQYNAAPRAPVYTSENVVGGFVQKYKNFEFWQINQAGHMVPLDQPEMALTMFRSIVGQIQVEKKGPARADAAAPQKAGKARVALRHPKRFLP